MAIIAFVGGVLLVVLGAKIAIEAEGETVLPNLGGVLLYCAGIAIALSPTYLPIF